MVSGHDAKIGEIGRKTYTISLDAREKQKVMRAIKRQTAHQSWLTG